MVRKLRTVLGGSHPGQFCFSFTLSHTLKHNVKNVKTVYSFFLKGGVCKGWRMEVGNPVDVPELVPELTLAAHMDLSAVHVR